jgi:GAF domain-containing protein
MSQADLPTSPKPQIPSDEEGRLAILATYQDTGTADHAESLDRIARLAAGLLGAPMACVSLIRRDDQLVVGRFGLDVGTTSRDVAFCSHTITGTEPMIVPDTHADPRFAENPFVTGQPGIRFYAGAPLISPDGGHSLGSLCILDHHLRSPLNAAQEVLLADLAALAMDDMERRRLKALSRPGPSLRHS